MANRDFTKIERIMKDFSLNLGSGEGGNSFSVFLPIYHNEAKLKNNLKEEFDIIDQTNNEVLYTGKTKILQADGKDIIVLDIPNEFLSFADINNASVKVIKLYWNDFPIEGIEIGIGLMDNSSESSIQHGDFWMTFMCTIPYTYAGFFPATYQITMQYNAM